MFSIDAVGTGSDDQRQLQKSIEELFLGVHQKKANLCNQTGMFFSIILCSIKCNRDLACY